MYSFQLLKDAACSGEKESYKRSKKENRGLADEEEGKDGSQATIEAEGRNGANDEEVGLSC